MTMASSPPPSISRVQASMLARAWASALVLAAHVMDERAAAALARGDHDLDAVAGEQPDRRLVDRRRQHRLRAAGEQRDPARARALRRDRRRLGHRRRGGRAAAPAGSIAASGFRPSAASSGANGLPSSASQQRQRGSRRGIGQHRGEQGAHQPVEPAAAGRSPRYGRGHDRPDACSARPTGRWSCRRGTTGSGRCA